MRPPSASAKRARGTPPPVRVLSEGEALAKPSTDDRSYRLVELPNAMRVLLISDPQMSAEEDTGDGHGDEDEGEGDSEEGEEGEEGEEEGEGADSEGEGADSVKKASFALCVGVGYLSDPPNANGLAHFVEHMVFMGTEKYPDENEWAAFLSSHGGEDNGETDAETTCFYFDVHPNYLREGLDRFCQFFAAPRFAWGSSERE
ncbi:peptidase M16, partial [Emiliania huxleyi CCMP1516]|uniref:Peptidase M16 N-terminal domain-containing protein n=4 Tax=Emiliania huxleyi TaxID=2903 RepID=A0A0D3I7Y6_EMIH1